jgi:hypothetical protein
MSSDSILDDNPVRRFAFNPPRITHESNSSEPDVVPKVLIVYESNFFMKRGPHGDVLGEFSQKLFDEVMNSDWKHIVLLFPKAAYLDALQQAVIANEKRIQLVELDADNVSNTMTSLISTIRLKCKINLQWKPRISLRNVSWLNLGTAIDPRSCQIQCVGADDQHCIGLEPDKEPSFQEFANKRSRAAWP